MPVVIGQEDLRNVGGHHRQVDSEIRKLATKDRRIAVDPVHPTRSGLAACHIERGCCRVHSDDGHPAHSEHACKRAGAAAHVEHGERAELIHHRDVVVEIRPIRVQRVIDRGEPRVIENRIGHDPKVGDSSGEAVLRFLLGTSTRRRT